MAESLDRKKKGNIAIDDDLIRDALKTELSSIKASEDLINKTLIRCREEIEKSEHKRENRSVMQWILKLGTPLAAGALVMVLLFNTNMFGSKGTPSAVPQPSEGKTLTSSMDKEAAGAAHQSAEQSYGASADAPADKGTDSVNRTEYEEQITLGASGPLLTAELKEEPALRSSVNNEPNDNAVFGTELQQLFNDIVDLYNQANETQLQLNYSLAARISCLVNDGVGLQDIREAQSFDDLISDSGYWALPLSNPDGGIEKILTVCSYDIKDTGIEITDEDIIYTIERKQYVVSELPASAENLDLTIELLHRGSSSEVLEGLTDIRESTVMIVDINDGKDFIFLSGSPGSRTAIPYLTRESIFGLDNYTEYTWDEFVETVTRSLEQ